MKKYARTGKGLCLLTMFSVFLCIKAGAQSCKMDSKFGSSNIYIPSKLTVGKEYHVKVEITNSGSCNWDKTHVSLSIKIVRGPSGAAMQRDELTPEKGMLLTQGTLSGKVAEFEYDITGPYYPGSYTMEWQLLADGKPFGVKVQKAVEVIPPK